MPHNGKIRFRPRWRTLLLLAVLGAVAWSAYSYWSEYSEHAARKAREMMAPVVGADCTVVFSAAGLGIEHVGIEHESPNPNLLHGEKNMVQGQFVQLNDAWIVLATPEKKQLWIPRQHILLLRVEP